MSMSRKDVLYLYFQILATDTLRKAKGTDEISKYIYIFKLLPEPQLWQIGEI
jgi:hypothetical protein